MNVDDIKNTPDDEFLEMMLSPSKIKKHLTKIIKDRSIILTGDIDHLSINYIINTTFADIDKPRKYDFQKETVHEDNAIRELERFIPFLSTNITKSSLEDGLSGKDWLVLDESYACRCADCAESMNMKIKGNEVHLTSEHKCVNNKVFTVEVDFPTGEIVYGDWPHRFSEAENAGLISRGSSDVNYLKGQRECTDEMASRQVYHHFVGNSCPSWYYNEVEGKIQIGGFEYDEDADERKIDSAFEDKGNFCTDLWWVTMIDRKFYDVMMSKLPKKRDEKYYEKEVETATIKPGRYRFTCYSAMGDQYNSPYATAEWIGECSDFVPSYQALNEDEYIMSLEDALAFRMDRNYKDYPIHPDTVKFNFLDHTFNVIGNGLSSKGDFYSEFKRNDDTIIPTFVPHTEIEPVFNHVYPCFDKKYSTIYQLELSDFPTDWLEGVKWFYEKCREYFVNGASNYSYAYPNTARDSVKDTKEFEEAIKRIRKEGMTDKQFYKAVSKAYECEYNGDLHDFRTRRWEKEKARCIAMIDETLKMITDYLDKKAA